MCYMSKCPYVPPHEWNIDFPHLMLRAKATRFKKEGASRRDRILSATDRVGTLAGIPVVTQAVNAVNRSQAGRKLLEKTLGVDREAPVPDLPQPQPASAAQGPPERGDALSPWARPSGQVALFATCYGNRNVPEVGEDLAAVFEHNGIPVTTLPSERCCGMPKLELGDLEAVARLKDENIPVMAAQVDAGWDLISPVPSCTLMFKQELPLMFPDDRGRGQGGGGDVRPLRIPDDPPQGGEAEYRTSSGPWARSPTRFPVTCGSRTSA